jgi:hypothetical protein
MLQFYLLEVYDLVVSACVENGARRRYRVVFAEAAGRVIAAHFSQTEVCRTRADLLPGLRRPKLGNADEATLDLTEFTFLAAWEVQDSWKWARWRRFGGSPAIAAISTIILRKTGLSSSFAISNCRLRSQHV